MKTTFAVTCYNEGLRGNYQWLLECLREPLIHRDIDEVLIYDDGSADPRELMNHLPSDGKVTTVFGGTNMGVYAAKIEAIHHSSGDWVITMDSDNRMEKGTMDALISEARNAPRNAWILPSFAMPLFNYESLVGEWTIDNIHRAIGIHPFDCWINTGNQTVNRREFMCVFEDHRGDVLTDAEGATDSTMLNDRWLRCGGILRCPSWFKYHHRVGTGKASNYVRAPHDKTRLQKDIIYKLQQDSICQK